MKKSLIALAVASAVAAPAAFAATSNVDVYGVMHFAIEDTDAANVDMDVKTNGSRIGFKGSEDLGGGLKAIWQIEQGFDATQNTDNTAFGGTGLRNTFIGLSGGFGTAILGRHDTPYKLSTTKYNVFGDTIADYAATKLDGVALITGHTRVNNALAYISPKMSGFTFAGALVLQDETSGVNTGMDGKNNLSMALSYANGPLTAELAYEDLDDATVANERKALKLSAGYTFGDTRIGAVYEDVDMGTGGTDRDSWYLSAVHNMGPIALKAQYGQADVGAADMYAWAVGVDYNLSKRTAAYIVYGNGDNDSGSDVSGYNIGVRHSF